MSGGMSLQVASGRITSLLNPKQIVGFVPWQDVLFGSIATEMTRACHVRFTPDSDRTADIAGGPVRANFGSRLFLIRSPRRRARAAELEW
jgi:hypothetical protein